jgi:hypothetical protein
VTLFLPFFSPGVISKLYFSPDMILDFGFWIFDLAISYSLKSTNSKFIT